MTKQTQTFQCFLEIFMARKFGMGFLGFWFLPPFDHSFHRSGVNPPPPPPPPAPDAVEIFRCSCSQFSFICSVRRLVTRHFKMAAKIVVVDELFKDLQRWGKEASLPGTLNYKYSSDRKLLLFLFCLIPFGFKYSFYVIRQFTLQRDIVVLNWDHFVLQDLS